MTIKTTVSKRGQTAVPAEICNKYGIKAGQKIAWLDLGNMVSVVPVPENPIKSFRGSSSGLYKTLISERKKERKREKD
ncbi:MAG: AbrB/MazE/SpoVT family DNA-binding domain-containing protein [Candidatus Saganbacteria bacterium]|nr:AbrB/MazE/SpoVT family DNA-binding domain-containing protein [Candidatus Saganbacteria bacterium]